MNIRDSIRGILSRSPRTAIQEVAKSISGAAALSLVLVLPWTASAAEFDTGGDWNIRWDNTLRYSSELRTSPRARALIADPNSDDGDRNFSPGIVSNRFDWISQLDISKGVYGLDISAAAWYDSVYWENTANKSSATFNPYSVSSGRFTRDVRALHGGDAEIQNAFVYGAATVGGRPLSFRLGRHTLLWGESLFFSDNGIAGAQAPVDYIKVHANPISYARDVYMPVAQASASLQLSNDLALDAYFQFEWRENREEGAGAYLNSEDFVYAGGERFIYEPGRYFYKENFLYPHDKGQFGVALRWTSGEADFGLYALRFNAKSPVVYFRPGIDLDTNADRKSTRLNSSH